jgi:hypothetical protein
MRGMTLSARFNTGRISVIVWLRFICSIENNTFSQEEGKKYLHVFLVYFKNTDDIDVGVLERLLNLSQFSILNLQNKICFRCHDRAS